MLAAARIAFGFCGLVVLFNAAIYAWRAALRRRAPECDPGEPLGVLHAAGAFVTECVATAAVLLLIPFGWLMAPSHAGTGSRGPIILLHGWALNRGSLWLLRRRLRRDGWNPICCPAYTSLGADVEGAAELLRPLVQQIGGDAQRPLTLAGHSLGGLVARYYVRRYPAPNVRRVVTIGTPHAGTELARLSGPLGARLAPRSPLLATLNAADRVPQQFDVIAIYSTFDAMILPPANAQYPGAFNVQVDDIGHNALLFSAKVYRLLFENLAAPLT